MSFLKKVLNQLFMKTITLQIMFEENAFSLSFILKGKALIYRDIMKHPVLCKYMKEAKPTHKENWFNISLECAELLYKDIQHQFFQNKGIEIECTEQVNRLEFRKFSGEIQFNYHFAPDEECLKRETFQDIRQLGAYYYLQGDTIWVLEKNELSTLISYEVLDAASMMKLLEFSKQPYIHIDVEMSMVSPITLSCKKLLDRNYILYRTYNIPKSEWYYMKQLPRYMLANYKIYDLSNEIVIEEVFQGEAQREIVDTEIPRFVAKYEKVFLTCGDETIKRDLNSNKILMNQNEVILALKCQADMKNGVGIPTGVPVFEHQGVCLSASQVLDQKRDGYIYAFDKWISSNLLRKIGVGEMNRLVDGTLISPVVLTPDEVINRGSMRLERLAHALLFDELDWKVAGSKEEILVAHLQFLRKYGLNGGVVVPCDEENLRTFMRYVNTLKSKIEQGKVLILMKKIFLEQCMAVGDVSDLNIIKGHKKNGQETERTTGIVMTTYHYAEKEPVLRETKWDIILMLEPDETFKTNTSKLYQGIQGIKSRLKLGLFKKDVKSYSTTKREAITKLFEINYATSTIVIRSLGQAISLPAPYKFTRDVANEEVGVQLIIDGDEEKQIPISFPKNFTQRGGNLRVEVRATYNSPGEIFKRKAEENKRAEGKAVPFVPFMSYWPTYDSMDSRQRAWYFYWRSQVKKGNYLETDLSYIFIYIYELINEVGYTSKEEGYQLLQQIWKVYRATFPKLDTYLEEWLVDYMFLHHMEHLLPEMMRENERIATHYLYNLYLYKNYIEGTAVIDQRDILKIMHYDIEKSKFYTAGYSEILIEVLTQIVHRIDAFMQSSYDQNIFRFFMPQEQKSMTRKVYKSAIYAGNEIYQRQYIDFLGHAPLSNFFDSITKYIENRLRQKYEFAGRLRGIELEEVFCKIIDEGLGLEQRKREDKLSSQKEKDYKPVSIRLDANKVQGLRDESEEMRVLLELQEDEVGCEIQIPNEVKIEMQEVGGEAIEQTHQEAPGISEEISEMASALEVLEDYQLEALQIIRSHKEVETRLNNLAMNLGTMADLLVDEINEAFYESMGDLMIDTSIMPPVIMEEYVVEIKNYFARVVGE